MRISLIYSVMLAGLLSQQALAGVTIDNFNDPSTVLAQGPGNPVVVTVADGGMADPEILGGYRDMTFTFFPGSSTGTAVVIYDSLAATTTFASTTATDLNVQLGYDGLGIPGIGLGANLSGDGSLGFILTADWNPNAAAAGTPLAVTFTVNGQSRTVAIADNLIPTAYFIPFAYWGGSVDFSAVSSIFLSFDLKRTENASFANFVTGEQGDIELAPLVPEPSTLALACMGLAGFGGYARRRMKARA